MKTTGPFAELGKQAAVVRERSHKVAELRMIQKEARALAERLFKLDYVMLGATILDVSESVGNLAKMVENK